MKVSTLRCGDASRILPQWRVVASGPTFGLTWGQPYAAPTIARPLRRRNKRPELAPYTIESTRLRQIDNVLLFHFFD
jgi:hypothetical protein